MKHISATELAKMGKCERQIHLEGLYGENPALTQKLRERGRQKHEQFERRVTGQDRRCFIATAVYGAEAAETAFFRAFRDRVLMDKRGGRIFVAVYYRLSPRIAAYLDKEPVSRWLCRLVLNQAYCWLKKVV